MEKEACLREYKDINKQKQMFLGPAKVVTLTVCESECFAVCESRQFSDL